jgi:hypothetical protein
LFSIEKIKVKISASTICHEQDLIQEMLDTPLIKLPFPEIHFRDLYGASFPKGTSHVSGFET